MNHLHMRDVVHEESKIGTNDYSAFALLLQVNSFNAVQVDMSVVLT
jgi:hypothetical protein